jgi:hypothetical protein
MSNDPSLDPPRAQPYHESGRLLLRGGLALFAHVMGMCTVVMSVLAVLWIWTNPVAHALMLGIIWAVVGAGSVSLMLIGHQQHQRYLQLGQTARAEHARKHAAALTAHADAVRDRAAAIRIELRTEPFTLLHYRWGWWTNGDQDFEYGLAIEFASLYDGNRRKTHEPLHRVRVMQSRDDGNWVVFHERESTDNLGSSFTLMLVHVPFWLRPRLVR